MNVYACVSLQGLILIHNLQAHDSPMLLLPWPSVLSHQGGLYWIFIMPWPGDHGSHWLSVSHMHDIWRYALCICAPAVFAQVVYDYYLMQVELTYSFGCELPAVTEHGVHMDTVMNFY